MKRVAITTGNQSKYDEIVRHLGVVDGIEFFKMPVEVDEIQSMDPDAVTEAKLKSVVAKMLEMGIEIPDGVIVEDTSLFISAYCGLPGPAIKTWLEQMRPAGIASHIRNERIRDAVEVCCIGLWSVEGGEHTFYKTNACVIAREPRGEGGHGYDSIVIPLGDNTEQLTYAEMSEGERVVRRPRLAACEALRDVLHVCVV